MTTLDSDEEGAADTGTQQTDGTPRTPDVETAATSERSSLEGIDSHASRQMFVPSTPPSLSSTRRYRKPTKVRQLTAQILEVATDVINGDVSGEALDRARLFSNLTRTAAQLISTEISRARYRQEEPDLSIGDDAED